MDVCLVRHAGESVLHRHMTAAPESCLKAVAPYRAGLVVAVACLCPWYGLADRGAAPDLPLVPGHALDRQALHGGTATHDPLESPKMAARRRGGMLPTASVYPAERRATRDLLRRTHLMRPRAERLSPVSKTHAQDHWPAIGQHITSNTPRAGVAARVHDPAVPTTLAVDRALLTNGPRLSGRGNPVPTTLAVDLALLTAADALLRHTPHPRPPPFPRRSTPHLQVRRVGVSGAPAPPLVPLLGARGPPGGGPAAVSTARPSRVRTPACRNRQLTRTTRRAGTRRRPRRIHPSWCTRAKHCSRSHSTPHVAPSRLSACAGPTAGWALRCGCTPSLRSE